MRIEVPLHSFTAAKATIPRYSEKRERLVEKHKTCSSSLSPPLKKMEGDRERSPLPGKTHWTSRMRSHLNLSVDSLKEYGKNALTL